MMTQDTRFWLLPLLYSTIFSPYFQPVSGLADHTRAVPSALAHSLRLCLQQPRKLLRAAI